LYDQWSQPHQVEPRATIAVHLRVNGVDDSDSSATTTGKNAPVRFIVRIHARSVTITDAKSVRCLAETNACALRVSNRELPHRIGIARHAPLTRRAQTPNVLSKLLHRHRHAHERASTLPVAQDVACRGRTEDLARAIVAELGERPRSWLATAWPTRFVRAVSAIVGRLDRKALLLCEARRLLRKAGQPRQWQLE
jgi:hypothetical protein